MTTIGRRFGAMVLALSMGFGLLLALPGSSDAADYTARMSPRLTSDLKTLPHSTTYGVFVHFRKGTWAERGAVLNAHSLDLATVFRSVNVAYAVGSLRSVRSLAEERAVSYLEANRALEYAGDTGAWASRARVAQTSVAGGPYRDSGGAVLDGRGVGVAVVDSGIDGTHPDLAARVGRNFKVVCSTPGLINTQTEQCFGPVVALETPNSDNTGGHGTHVSGIVAGDGTASAGTYQGVAPGATLYGYGAGEVISVLTAAESFQHILNNYNSFTPRIRVVNNSWGDSGGTPYDADSVLSKLTRDLVARGVTVVFAAGNDGGNGSADQTSSTAKDPTAGVITAANYDDADTGNRDNVLDSTSSRGRNGQPATYPDVSAPGANIISTCRPTMPICDAGPSIPWAPDYAALGGTSMASPHIAGIAALLYQAQPGLTPAQVEDALLDTAHKFTAGAAYVSDPQNSGATTSFDKGAGLVNVPAALNALGVAHGTSPTGPQTVTTGDGGDYPAQGAADITSLSVQGEATGLRYTLGVRDVDDVGPTTISLRITQNVDGKPFTDERDRVQLRRHRSGCGLREHGTGNAGLARHCRQHGDLVRALQQSR